MLEHVCLHYMVMHDAGNSAYRITAVKALIHVSVDLSPFF